MTAEPPKHGQPDMKKVTAGFDGGMFQQKSLNKREL